MRNTILVTILAPCMLAAQSGTSFEERIQARGDAISGALGFDLTSQYFFRGIQQENQGFIVQPWIELALNLHESERGLRNLKVEFGQRNSLHDGPTGGAGGIWYESQFFLGLEAQIGERLHVGMRYNTFASPNGSAVALIRPVQELAFLGRFDDRGVFGDNISLQPTAMIAFELVGQREGGANKGIYVELGISPSWVIGHLGASDVTLSAPVTLGISLLDYYERTGGGGGNNDFFGFLQGGAVVTTDLDFMPARLGPWTGHAGLHLIVLGDNNEARNGGDAAEIFFEFGMSTTF